MANDNLLPDGTPDPFNEITKCPTPPDASIYPGTANLDADGNIIFPAVPTVEDAIKSYVGQAHQYGLKHPTEINYVYPNPLVPGDLLDPEGKKSVFPQKPIDRSKLFQKMVPHVADESFVETLRDLEEPVDFRSLMPDINSLARQGDARWSLGCATQQVFQKFLPRIEAYKELLEAGAAVIDGECNFCTEDGVQVKKPSKAVQNYFKELRKNVPLEEKISIEAPTAEEIMSYMDQQKDTAFKNHADAFVIYIKRNYLDGGWKAENAEAVFINPPGFFFLRFTKKANPPVDPITKVKIDDDMTVIRYYGDQKDYVISQLNIPFVEAKGLAVTEKYITAMASLSRDIPDYTRLV
jgi:hypothetical protein